VVPLAESHPTFASHPEFIPLIDRMKKIKRIDSTDRPELVDPEERLRRFPLPPPSGKIATYISLSIYRGSS
jgi:hypothetical protein